MLNKGTTGTIFTTSLVWRSPWLGIEPSKDFLSQILSVTFIFLS